jgi:glycosyltransferase involved in cell wall biosynthesis
MSELVSILVPAYNSERWLAATLQSALDQTWPQVEIIVVDDGSRDGTLAVARTFERRNVKVVTQPNQGAPASRNHALTLAQGTYIQWLDADDLLHPNKISAQMQVAAQCANRRLLLSGRHGLFYFRPERATFTPTTLWADLTPIDYFIARFTQNLFLQTGVWMVSRELTAAAGPWSPECWAGDDGEYFCRVVAASDGVKFVNDALLYYRVGNYGALNKARSSTAQSALFTAQTRSLLHLLALEDSPRTRAAAVQMLQDWLPEFYKRPDLVGEARALARRLGGELHAPSMHPKYRPIAWLFGYPTAVAATRVLPKVRDRAARKWDEWLYRLTTTSQKRSNGVQPQVDA